MITWNADKIGNKMIMWKVDKNGWIKEYNYMVSRKNGSNVQYEENWLLVACQYLLAEKTWKYILGNFEEIYYQIEFENLSSAEVIALPCNDGLKVNTEMVVVKSAVLYLQKNSKWVIWGLTILQPFRVMKVN